MLKDGKKRPEIAEELGITMAECTKLFQHPKLKGRKALKPVSFELVDDLEEEKTTGELVQQEVEQEEAPMVAEENTTEVENSVEDQEEIQEERPVPIFQNN